MPDKYGNRSDSLQSRLNQDRMSWLMERQDVDESSQSHSGTSRPAIKRPPYRVYAFLIAMIFIARAFALVTQDMEWTIGVYNSPAWNVVFFTLCVVLSFASGFFFRRHLPPLIAWMSCGVVGGICMLLINSIPGAIIGLCIGGLIVGQESHRGLVRSFAPYLGRTILPSACLGFATGCAVGSAWFHWGASRPGVWEWLTIGSRCAWR